MNVLHIRVTDDYGVTATTDHAVVEGQRGHLLAILERIPESWAHLENVNICVGGSVVEWNGDSAEVPSEAVSSHGRKRVSVTAFTLKDNGSIDELVNSTPGYFVVTRAGLM